MTRRRHDVHTAAAARDGSSHSHTHVTSQPAASSSCRWRSSRTLLASNFAAHHAAFAWGRVPCNGQECQKSPMTNTAILALVNTTSGRAAPTFRWTRKRRPSACSSRRNAISGTVPDVRCRAIWRRTTSLLATGRALTQPSSVITSW